MSLILRLLHIFLTGVLFCVLHCDSTVAGTPYSFPDPGLQAAVAEAIGKATTELTLEDLSSPFFTLLPAESRKIRNLEGIEKCTSLIEVVLSGNEIEDLRPLSKLIGLRSLSLDKNQIKDLAPLSDLIHLEDLWISNNEISCLAPIKNLTELKALIADNNTISDLEDLQALSSLRYLSFTQDWLHKLSFRLQEITLPHNTGSWSMDTDFFTPSVPGFSEIWIWSSRDYQNVFTVFSNAYMEYFMGLSYVGFHLEKCMIKMSHPISKYPLSP